MADLRRCDRTDPHEYHGWDESNPTRHHVCPGIKDDEYTPTTETVRGWRGRQGDVWTEGADGLMHTPETAPFPREHVEKKWGPLVPVSPNSGSAD